MYFQLSRKTTFMFEYIPSYNLSCKKIYMTTTMAIVSSSSVTDGLNPALCYSHAN